MKNIMVTAYEGEDNVCLFCERLTAKEVQTVLEGQGKTFEDVFEVPDDQMQYYIYEPLPLSAEVEDKVKLACSKMS